MEPIRVKEGVNMPKVRIEVVNGGDSTTKKYPIKNGTIIIKMGGHGAKDFNWLPPYDPARIIKAKGLIFSKKKAFYLADSKELMPIIANGKAPDFTAEPLIKAVEQKILEKQAKTSTQLKPIEIMFALGLLILIGMVGLLLVSTGVINLG